MVTPLLVGLAARGDDGRAGVGVGRPIRVVVRVADLQPAAALGARRRRPPRPGIPGEGEKNSFNFPSNFHVFTAFQVKFSQNVI